MLQRSIISGSQKLFPVVVFEQMSHVDEILPGQEDERANAVQSANISLIQRQLIVHK